MNYDIAVGPCVALEGGFVIIKLEGVLLRKLLPSFVFKVRTDALLRVPLALCSQSRPPQPGQEVYLDFSRVEAGMEAFVDPGGDGHYETVDIRQLLQNLNPLTAPVMTPKPRAAHWPIKPGR